MYEKCLLATINHYPSENVSKGVPQMIYKNESLTRDRVVLRKDSNNAARKKNAISS